MITLPPSRANIWVPCPGSARAESFFSDRDTSQTSSGKALHDAAEKALADLQLWGSPQPIPCADELTPDDLTVVEFYINDVAARLAEGDIYGASPADLLVEHKVPLYKRPDRFGRIDCALVRPGRIIVWDLKTGFIGRDAKNDWQTRDYVLSLIEQNGMNGIEDQNTLVEIRIVQPRAFGHDRVSVWLCHASKLRGDFNAIDYAIEAAAMPEPPVKAGLHCVNCRAFTRCQTARAAADQILTVSENLEILDLTDADQAAAVYLLKPRLKLAAKLLDALENSVKAVIENGGSVPGWVLRTGKGRKTWANENGDAAVLDALSMYGINGAKPPQLAAISAIEPAASRAGVDLVAAGLVKTAPGAKYLVPAQTHGAGAGVFGAKTPNN